MPSFPDSDGNTIEGEDMARQVEAIAAALGERLFLDSGVRRFGKHSWRATRAVYHAECGV